MSLFFFFRHGHIHGQHHSHRHVHGHSHLGGSYSHSHNANMEGKFILWHFEFVTEHMMFQSSVIPNISDALCLCGILLIH